MGGVTKIWARQADCVDKNNNGMIDTSSGPGDVLPETVSSKTRHGSVILTACADTAEALDRLADTVDPASLRQLRRLAWRRT